MLVDTNAASKDFDVFNGDADGICALHQLRLHESRDATLITGAKRDIDLLTRFQSGPGDRLTILDISLDANIRPLREHLSAGAMVSYFDHHNAAQAFEHEHLQLFCDTAADVCTSILVNRYLGEKYAHWAVVAAYGDNLQHVARQMAQQLGMSPAQCGQLHELGTLINYNAYGESVEDLHFHPAALYQAVHIYTDPFDFINTATEFAVLRKAYAEDMLALQGISATWQAEACAIYILPAKAWARRVSGILANQLSVQDPGKSFAVLTARSDASYVVSVRSGQPDTHSASQFCSRFVSGGGRRSAAGINQLAASEVEYFTRCFAAYFEQVPSFITQTTS
ncbi:hypothetical protein ACO0LH_13195 [Undibacterium sp. TJN19]